MEDTKVNEKTLACFSLVGFVYTVGNLNTFLKKTRFLMRFYFWLQPLVVINK